MGLFSSIIRTITSPLHLIGSVGGTIVGNLILPGAGGIIGGLVGGEAGSIANSKVNNSRSNARRTATAMPTALQATSNRGWVQTVLTGVTNRDQAQRAATAIRSTYHGPHKIRQNNHGQWVLLTKARGGTPPPAGHGTI